MAKGLFGLSRSLKSMPKASTRGPGPKGSWASRISLVTAIIALILAATLVYFLLRKVRRAGYQQTLLQQTGGGDGTCADHCFRNSTGEVSDQYDCCECKAQVAAGYGKGTYEPNFRKCMCAAGYPNFCFKPVTNFLLSQ